ncbi:hypothetical protein [Kitasatospora sp. NPDC048407]
MTLLPVTAPAWPIRLHGLAPETHNGELEAGLTRARNALKRQYAPVN